MNASRPSKPGLHLRHKRSSSSSDLDLLNSHVHRPPRSPVLNSPDHSTQRKTLAKTSSSLSKQGKSPPYQQRQTPQPSTSTVAKKSPVRKPIEKPRSPSLPNQIIKTPPNRSPSLPAQSTRTPPNRSPSLPTQRTRTPPNPKNSTTVKSPSTPLKKPAVSSRPVSDKTLKTTTAKTSDKSKLTLSKPRSLVKGKEAIPNEISSNVEVSVAVAPQHGEKEKPSIEFTQAGVPVVKVDMHDELEVTNIIESNTTTDLTTETDAYEPIEQYEPVPAVQEVEPEVIDIHDEVNSHEVESNISELEESNESIVTTKAPEMEPTDKNIEEPIVEASNIEDQEVETEYKEPLVEEASTEEKVVEELSIVAPVEIEKETVEKEAQAAVVTAPVTPRKREVVIGKKTETPTSNAVIEETRSKLLEERKSKVKALVGAFETVMS